MAIPTIFSQQGDATVASYNYIDILTGVGYLELYGGDWNDNATQKYILSQNPFYADKGQIQSGAGGVIDIDFDIPIGKTITFYGDAIINVPGRAVNSGTYNFIVTAKIRKYSGSTETEIANVVLNRHDSWSDYKPACFAGKISVPKTVFSKGDILRLSLITTVAGGQNLELFFDPMNRTTILGNDYSAVDYRQLKLNMPIFIDK